MAQITQNCDDIRRTGCFLGKWRKFAPWLINYRQIQQYILLFCFSNHSLYRAFLEMFKNAESTHTQLCHVFTAFPIKSNPGFISLLSDSWKFIALLCVMSRLPHLVPPSFFPSASLGIRMLTVSWIGAVHFFSYNSELPKIKATLLAEADAVCQLYSLLPAKDWHPAVNNFMFRWYIK